MPELFEETNINGLKLKNRFVRSATWMGLAAMDGTCTSDLIERMVELASGGVGLIITGHAYVQKNGQAGPWQLGVDKDEHIPGLKKLTASVHHAGGKIVIQLAHAGIYSAEHLTGGTPLAVSKPAGGTSHPIKEITDSDIEDIITSFGMAAARAKAAGFDGVQIHAAHGYLLNQFLSPAFNRREDTYGGVLENRARIIVDVVCRIRQILGPNYPVLIKMNARDFLPHGLKLEDAVRVGMMLERKGVAAIEVSGGTRDSGRLKSSRSGISTDADEAYFQNEARQFKAHLNIPVMLVGGIRSYHVAEKVIKNKSADYIAMSRPFIREPGIINRWGNGDFGKSRCLSDRNCLGTGLKGGGVCCTEAPNEAFLEISNGR
jgi:2,4-dienoyl-CoA reductase-like NADH-dependent reductase (Old Yellow Enzyme family)